MTFVTSEEERKRTSEPADLSLIIYGPGDSRVTGVIGGDGEPWGSVPLTQVTRTILSCSVDPWGFLHR